MTTTVLRPDDTAGSSGLITGAASAHAALSDNSDSSYVDSWANLMLQDFTLPTGSVTKTFRVRGRGRAVAGAGQMYLVGLVRSPGAGTFVTAVGGLTTTPSEVSSAEAPVSLAQVDVNNLGIYFAYSSSSNSANTRCFELYGDLTYVTRPVVAVTAVSPDPYTASNSVPIDWVNTFDADGGTQTRYHVRVFSAAQYGAGGFDPGTSDAVYDSGSTLSSSTGAIVGPLPTATTYRAYVRVAQTVNGAAHWSAWAYDQFAVSVTTSDIADVTVAADNGLARIDITVARDTGTPLWERLEIERSIDAGVTWVPVRGSTLVTVGVSSTYVTVDYEPGNNVATRYRARATYYSSGLPIVGPWRLSNTTAAWTSDKVWIKSLTVSALNVALWPIGRPVFTRERAAGVHRVIGVARPVVVSGVMSTRSGTIGWSTTTPAEAAALDRLADEAVILVQWPPVWDTADLHCVPLSVEPAVVSVPDATLTVREWAMSVVEVDPPADTTAGVL